MYYKAAAKCEAFDYTSEMSVAREEKTYTVKASTTVNGKTEHRTQTISPPAPLFFQSGAVELYKSGGFLAKNGDTPCCLLETRFLTSENGYFCYKGTEDVKKGEKTIKCKKVCLLGRIDFLMREDGNP